MPIQTLQGRSNFRIVKKLYKLYVGILTLYCILNFPLLRTILEDCVGVPMA